VVQIIPVRGGKTISVRFFRTEQYFWSVQVAGHSLIMPKSIWAGGELHRATVGFGNAHGKFSAVVVSPETIRDPDLVKVENTGDIAFSFGSGQRRQQQRRQHK